MKPVLSAAIMLLFWANLALAQTASDLETRYGAPVKVFSVSEHIWMTPDFAANGQMCRLSFFHKRTSPEMNYLGHSVPVHELLTVFRTLVPLDVRGARKQFFGTTQTSASMAWTDFSYENVTFSFWTAFAFGSLADMRAKKVPIGGRTPTPTSQSDDDFMAANAVPPVMVHVTWSNRKCVGE